MAGANMRYILLPR